MILLTCLITDDSSLSEPLFSVSGLNFVESAPHVLGEDITPQSQESTLWSTSKHFQIVLRKGHHCNDTFVP